MRDIMADYARQYGIVVRAIEFIEIMRGTSLSSTKLQITLAWVNSFAENLLNWREFG